MTPKTALYEKLHPWQTRVLYLQPGKFGSVLRANLYVADIIFSEGLVRRGATDAQAEHVDYDALSYFWGATECEKHMICNGSKFPIRDNLFQALQYIRHEDNPQYLWIDAVCINQADNLEKGFQVFNMLSIYMKARKVIGWLGLEGQNTAYATEFALGRIVKGSDDRIVKAKSDKDRKESWSLQEVYEGLLDLYERPWFQRIWVQQEIFAARELVILCGKQEIPSKALAAGPNQYNWSTWDVRPRIPRYESSSSDSNRFSEDDTSEDEAEDDKYEDTSSEADADDRSEGSDDYDQSAGSENESDGSEKSSLKSTSDLSQNSRRSVRLKHKNPLRSIHLTHKTYTKLCRESLPDVYDSRMVAFQTWVSSSIELGWRPGGKPQLRKPPALVEALVITSSLSATNERDRLYGVLGLSNTPSRVISLEKHNPMGKEIAIDYNAAVRDVFISLTLWFFAKYQSFTILMFANPPPAARPPKDPEEGLPSWVIDWSRPHGLLKMFEAYVDKIERLDKPQSNSRGLNRLRKDNKDSRTTGKLTLRGHMFPHKLFQEVKRIRLNKDPWKYPWPSPLHKIDTSLQHDDIFMLPEVGPSQPLILRPVSQRLFEFVGVLELLGDAHVIVVERFYKMTYLSEERDSSQTETFLADWKSWVDSRATDSAEIFIII
jgi:hypothetical protein